MRKIIESGTHVELVQTGANLFEIVEIGSDIILREVTDAEIAYQIFWDEEGCLF